jgi:hypothetical protein
MIIVPAHAALEIEQLGSRDKYWFRSEDEHIRTLFKVGRPNTGEHWAEIVVARIAAYLSIPHAPYELASDGRLGVATPSLVQVHGATRLIHGNEVLARAFQSYPADKARPGAAYNLVDIYESLKIYHGLREYDAPTEFGLYLLLDALVANQDRHHENWGLLENSDAARVLAPTFDHAASLACRLTDRERENRLNTRDAGYSLETYARRARTWFYSDSESAKRLATVEAFRSWTHRMAPRALAEVATKLTAADESTWTNMFDDLGPAEMTRIQIAFTVRLLVHNTSRLINVLTSVVR